MTTTQLIRRIAAIVLFAACLASWLLLGGSLLFDLPRSVKIIALVATVVSTEAAVWGGAVLLGWTALANRASILRRLRREQA